MPLNEIIIEDEFKTLYDEARSNGATEKFTRFSERCAAGHWRDYVGKFDGFTRNLKGAVFVDFGCKFGHITPLLKHLGVEQIYSVDVDREHLDQGAKFIGKRYGSIYVESQDCMVDIPSNSVDMILVNEVISHINPSILDSFYQEMCRILKPGGEIIISDGNNYANFSTYSDLIDWYLLWEHGKSKEFGEKNYSASRRSIIRRTIPGLTNIALDTIAENTAGLAGEGLTAAARRYQEGTFQPRPIRIGVAPTHPTIGVVMERGFYPIEVELSLRRYGVDTVQLLRGKPISDGTQRGATKNFTIRGTKIDENVETFKALALKTTKEFGLLQVAGAVADYECGPAPDPIRQFREGFFEGNISKMASAERALPGVGREVGLAEAAALSASIQARKAARETDPRALNYAAWRDFAIVAENDALITRKLAAAVRQQMKNNGDTELLVVGNVLVLKRYLALEKRNVSGARELVDRQVTILVRLVHKGGSPAEVLDFIEANSLKDRFAREVDGLLAIARRRIQIASKAGDIDTVGSLLAIVQRIAPGLYGNVSALATMGFEHWARRERKKEQNADIAKLARIVDMQESAPDALFALARTHLQQRNYPVAGQLFRRLASIQDGPRKVRYEERAALCEAKVAMMQAAMP